MNRFMTIAVASTFAAASFGTAALAESSHAPSASHFNRHDDSGDNSGVDNADAGYGTIPSVGVHSAGVNWTIRHWKGRPFEVMPIEEIDSNGETASVEAKESEARHVAHLQAAIEHNRALSHRLTAENVNVHDVVDGKAAIDGTMIFYVR